MIFQHTRFLVFLLLGLLFLSLPAWADTKQDTPSLFTVAAVGDIIASEHIEQRMEQKSPELVHLLQTVDAAFGNFEGSAFNIKEFNGSPQAVSGGSWFLSPADEPQDLRALGFTLLSHANNHATDWGAEGLLETDKNMDRADTVHAGSGADLTAARAPHFKQTPAGKISLVAAALTFTDIEPAADPVSIIPGRPGISMLRSVQYVRVPPDQFDLLRKIVAELPRGAIKKKQLKLISKEKGAIPLLDTNLEPSPNPRETLSFHYVANEKDKAQILSNVEKGKREANYLLFSMHAHDPGNFSDDPPDLLPGFAHDVIDAGADIFVGHGPHRMRGIEIYKGKPIFYSLGNFSYHTSHSLDAYAVADRDRSKVRHILGRPHKMASSSYNSVVAVIDFDKDRAREIRLYPIHLDTSPESKDYGLPHMTSPAHAKKILLNLQKLSEPFGTKIDIRSNVGYISLM